MGYTKRNKYLRIIDVQAEFKKHFKPGMIIEHIYNEHIKEKFHISRTTFFAWLKVDAAGELSKLDELQNTKKAAIEQLEIFQ